MLIPTITPQAKFKKALLDWKQTTQDQVSDYGTVGIIIAFTNATPRSHPPKMAPASRPDDIEMVGGGSRPLIVVFYVCATLRGGLMASRLQPADGHNE